MNRIPYDINSRLNNRHRESMCAFGYDSWGSRGGREKKGRTQITDIFPFVIQ